MQQLMLGTLEEKIRNKKSEISNWLQEERKKLKIPFYTSVDIRNSGFKISAIDTNLFPAGFNNLCPSYLRYASELVKKYLNERFPFVQKILILPESHTRNLFYLSNLKRLETIIKGAGFKVCVGSLGHEITDEQNGNEDPDEFDLKTAENELLHFKRLKRRNGTIFACEEKEDLIILNNDLSDGIPEILQEIEVPIIPLPKLGWAYRKKSDHFRHYQRLIEIFSKIIDIDPWHFFPITKSIEHVDFLQNEDVENIAKEAETLFGEIQKKYDQYGIDEKPFIFVKSNSGTYGMGVEKFETIEEILTMNRKQKNKLASGKGGQKVTSVIIQEGITTIDRYQNFVAEPVIYLIGGEVTGGFFRLNEEKGDRDNLNARGMRFNRLCFHEISGYHNKYNEKCDLECLTVIYFTIAQIAALAAGLEAEELKHVN